MRTLNLSNSVKEKIFDIKYDKNDRIESITTYFPLGESELNEISENLKKNERESVIMKSIFSDEISDDDWEKNKSKIAKKFHDELLDID